MNELRAGRRRGHETLGRHHPDEEQDAYRAAGFGRPTGIGQRPALLIIDVQYRTVGTEPRPFWESIKEFPTSCGEVGWARGEQHPPPARAFPRQRLARALSARLAEGDVRSRPPVRQGAGHHGDRGAAATTSSPRSRRARATSCCRRSIRARSSARRSRATWSGSAPTRWSSPAARPAAACAAPSSTASRTISASLVPHDCVYDRSAMSHAVNLFDMSEKYADVVTTAEAIDRLGTLSRNAPADARRRA